MEIFNSLVSLIGDIFNFLDSTIIIGHLSLLRIFFLILLFDLALMFLFNHKGE